LLCIHPYSPNSDFDPAYKNLKKINQINNPHGIIPNFFNNLSAILLSELLKIEERLYRFYTVNKWHEGIDIAGIVSLITFVLMDYPLSAFEDTTITVFQIHVLVIGLLIYTSFVFFLSSLREINKTESKLGVGKPISSR
jgi:Kef-type K+ transport system membrane component KefB